MPFIHNHYREQRTTEKGRERVLNWRRRGIWSLEDMAERCDLIMMRKPCHSIFTGHPLQLSKLFNNRVSSFSPLHSFMKPPAPTSSSSSCSVSRVMAMVFALTKKTIFLGSNGNRCLDLIEMNSLQKLLSLIGIVKIWTGKNKL